VAEVKRLVARMGASATWVIGPPEFILEVDDDDRLGVVGAEQDEPLVILGGLLRLYSARRPLELPAEVDQAQLRSVEAVVSELEFISEMTGAEFALLFHGETVGFVDASEGGRSLRLGLLDPWRKALEDKTGAPP